MHEIAPKSRRSGFSLVELIVVVAILAILAGTAVPIATKALTYKARQATRNEIQYLADSAGEYVLDTEVIPPDIAALLVEPSAGVPGWAGPYLPGVSADEVTGAIGYSVDAWSRPYQFQSSGSILTIESMGEDAAWGTTRDIVLDFDVTPLRRRLTLDRLETINQAVTLYNGAYQATDPLPADYTALVARLVATGFLPNTSGFDSDGWGNAFVEDPVSETPVVRVTSTSL